MKGMIRDSLLELFDRKIIYLFAVVTLITVVVVFLMRSIEVHIQTQSGFGADNLEDFLGNQFLNGLSTFMSFLLFLAVMATAGLIPNMLVKGRADFYLSKPMSRSSVYMRKIGSMWLVYGGIILVCGIIGTLAIGLFHDYFSWGMLYIIIFKLVSFFVWLSIIAFVGIISGSTSVSIMGAFIVYIVQWLLDKRELIAAFIDSKPVTYVADILYYIWPKTEEVSDLTLRLAQGREVFNWMPLWSTLLFTLVLIYLTIFIFKRKEY